ncbi:nucleotidyltransferase domain-containing protein [uncultured Brachyspira sp.]|mgnify:CR=1 FL=1|uniref:nucleotidyltransferase domain-containing protein n=1 Tax=uncultured Brachyspira sp. TaxID=221953 RepID=UPI0025CD1703|nr:nucleotidyltransferase domain-containing protein [uncultured Brachyspira sp.]
MLDEKIKKGIKNICSSYENIEKVILFGSRAMDKEKYNSDIDLAVVGEFDLLFCERLKEELSYLPTLLKFDVISYNEIENQELINDIKNYGKTIYKKEY